jgi:hypothetical protein
MAVKYIMRVGGIGDVDGISIPALGLVSDFAVATLEKYCQDVLGSTSPLIKSAVETVAVGAPANFDTLLELANGKLTAVQATTVAAIGMTANLTLTAPVAVNLNAVFSDTEVEAALLAKADQSAVSSLVTAIEARLDTGEGKIDAILSALKIAGIMA